VKQAPAVAQHLAHEDRECTRQRGWARTGQDREAESGRKRTRGIPQGRLVQRERVRAAVARIERRTDLSSGNPMLTTTGGP
jgi:hypothetical protein